MHDVIYEEPPLHDRCRCKIEAMHAVYSGFATREGANGANYWLWSLNQLPEYYPAKQEAKALGWRAIAGNLSGVAPGKMIGGDIYQNRNGQLPVSEGRIWFEADINFVDGYRSRHRTIYSNDGLIFVTYSHYETFIEII